MKEKVDKMKRFRCLCFLVVKEIGGNVVNNRECSRTNLAWFGGSILGVCFHFA